MSTDLAAVTRRRETIKSAPRVVRSPCWFDQKSNRSSSSSSPAGAPAAPPPAPPATARRWLPLNANLASGSPSHHFAARLLFRRGGSASSGADAASESGGEVRTTSERQPRPDTQTVKSPQCGGAFQVGDTTPSSYCGAKDQSGKSASADGMSNIPRCASRAVFPKTAVI